MCFFFLQYFFTSFLFRDEAYKLVHEGWLQHGSGSKAMDQQVTECFHI